MTKLYRILGKRGRITIPYESAFRLTMCCLLLNRMTAQW